MTSLSRLFLLAATLFAGALLSGCGGEDEQARSSATTASAPAAEDAMTLGAPGRELPAGEYRSTTFLVPIEFSLGTGWSNGGGELAEILDVFWNPTGSFSFVAPQRVVDPADPKGVGSLAVPKDLAAFLHAHPRLETGPVEQTVVGGRPAVAFDVEVPQKTALSLAICPRACVPLAEITDVGQLGFLAGERGRIYVVPGQPRTLVMLYGSSGDAVAAQSAASEEIVRSVRFTG